MRGERVDVELMQFHAVTCAQNHRSAARASRPSSFLCVFACMNFANNHDFWRPTAPIHAPFHAAASTDTPRATCGCARWRPCSWWDSRHCSRRRIPAARLTLSFWRFVFSCGTRVTVERVEWLDGVYSAVMRRVHVDVEWIWPVPGANRNLHQWWSRLHLVWVAVQLLPDVSARPSIAPHPGWRPAKWRHPRPRLAAAWPGAHAGHQSCRRPFARRLPAGRALHLRRCFARARLAKRGRRPIPHPVRRAV